MNPSFVMLACSGPRAMVTIQQSLTIGYFCAVIGGAITLALAYEGFRTRHLGFTLLVAALMLLIHPAWTISAVHGDCGMFKREVSYFFTVAYFGIIAYQFALSRRAG